MISLVLTIVAADAVSDTGPDVSNINFINHTPSKISIDGVMVEEAWSRTQWRSMPHVILGEKPSIEDFSGKFKLLWDEDYLYVLAKIKDDKLFDRFPNPLERYWDDDCLEVFIDEDNSGGDHLYSFNAFAYHVGLDNQVVDIGEKMPEKDAEVLLLNEHVKSRWQRQKDAPYDIVWELAIKLFDKNYQHGANQTPVKLKKNKQIGFMLAYCDNDGSEQREHFVGSYEIAPVNGDKNLGYKTADVFETFQLTNN